MNAFVISIGVGIIFTAALAYLGWRIIVAVRLKQLDRRANKRKLAELQRKRQLADERRRDPRVVARKAKAKEIEDWDALYDEMNRRHGGS